MNKKLLIFSLTIIIILLACFVIAQISGITFDAPINDEIISGNYSFNSTVSYDLYADTNVTFYYNLSETEQFYLCNCTNVSLSKETTEAEFKCTYDTSQLDDGTYNFTVIAIDNYSNREFERRNDVIVDNNPPTIKFIFPEEEHANKISNINFTYTPSDVSLSSCTLSGSWNGSLKTLNPSPTNNIENIFIQRGIPEGWEYIWNISCNDSLDRITTISDRTLTIDWTDPTSINHYLKVEYEKEEYINCNCTASDEIDPYPTCSDSSCSTSSSGDKTAIFTATDAAGNTFESKFNYTVLEEPPAEGEGEAESEGEAEGEGEGEPEPRTEEKCWDILEAGATINYEVDDEEIGIRKITIIPNKALSNTCLKVKQVISITTAGVTKYSDDNKVYKYFQIEPTGISDDDLTSVNIEFSIAKSFFYDHHRDTTNLNRYKEGWDELDTEDLSQDEINYAFFEAESPGFSDFVIVSDKRITGETVGTGPGCGDGICDPDENSTTCCQDCGCALGFECLNNSCEKSSKFIVFQWFERAYNDVKEWIEEKIKFDWITNKWWLGLPIWAWIIIGAAVVAAGILGFIFRKKIKFPFEVNFSVHKKHYGFR